MTEAGRRLASVMEVLKSSVRPGVPTRALDTMAERLIRDQGCTPSFLNYAPHGSDKPFPFSICVSVNSTVVHGLPSEYVVQEGDLVKLDLGLAYKGWHSDMAVTVGAGEIDSQKKKLIRATEEALQAGIRATRAGNTFGDIGAAVYETVEKYGFDVVRALTGHGIGRALHEDPYVFNYGRRGEGDKIKSGMVLALEPMVVTGSYKVRQLPDDSFVTADGSLAAHFEHTVAITENGPRILTAT